MPPGLGATDANVRHGRQALGERAGGGRCRGERDGDGARGERGGELALELASVREPVLAGDAAGGRAAVERFHRDRWFHCGSGGWPCAGEGWVKVLQFHLSLRSSACEVEKFVLRFLGTLHDDRQALLGQVLPVADAA